MLSCCWQRKATPHYYNRVSEIWNWTKVFLNADGRNWVVSEELKEFPDYVAGKPSEAVFVLFSQEFSHLGVKTNTF